MAIATHGRWCRSYGEVMARTALLTFRCLLLGTLLAGCAELPTPPTDAARQGWGAVVVVPARYPPLNNFHVFAVGQEKAAGKGALSGASLGLASAAVYASMGALEAVIAPYLAVIMVPVGAAMGAYAGSQAGLSEQDAAALEGHIQQHLAALQVSSALARAIVETADRDAGQRLPLLGDDGPASPDAIPDYQTLARQGAGSVLEVVAAEAGFTGGRQLSFHLVATVRLLRVSDGGLAYERDFVYQSDKYEGRLWGENMAALFQAELQRAYASLAESVVEQVFLLSALPLHSQAKPSGEAGLMALLGGRDACGLAWVSPKHDYHPGIGDTDHRNWTRFPIVESRQPTLAWEAFPREGDIKSDAGPPLSGISDIRYDLRVWQAAAEMPPRLVYERRDLTATFHTLEQPLSPASRYYWSARSRFNLGGGVHGTKWGYFRSPYYESHGKVMPEPSAATVLGVGMAGVAPRDPCTLDFIPTSNYYRFQTP